MSYKKKLNLDKMSPAELKWWIENLRVFGGKYLFLPKTQVVSRKDASLMEWGLGKLYGCGSRKKVVFVRKSIHISPILPDSDNFQQDKKGKDYFSISSHTSLEVPSLVLRSPGSFHLVSSTASSKENYIIKSSARESSSLGDKNIKSCGRNVSRKDFLQKEIQKLLPTLSKIKKRRFIG